MPKIIIEYSYWWILLFLLLSVGASWLLYSRKHPWSTNVNRFLIILRAILIFILLFLLLNPLLNQFSSELIKPKIIVGIDNSLSMVNGKDSLSSNELETVMAAIRESADAKNYEVIVRDFDEKRASSKEIIFDATSTNLDRWIRNIEMLHQDDNMACMFLVSDGRNNLGASPSYFSYLQSIHTIGVGDTAQRNDLMLKEIYANKIAYQGNLFPLKAEIVNKGFSGLKSRVELREGGKLIDKKEVAYSEIEGITTVDFEVEAKSNGLKQYVISVEQLDGEASWENNRMEVYVDVLNGKEKVLILAAEPHPDIKAIRTVLQQNENIEVEVFVPNVSGTFGDDYSVAIVHQPYDRQRRTWSYLDKLKTSNTPICYVIGPKTDLSAMSKKDASFVFRGRSNEKERIYPSVDAQFNLFEMSATADAVLAEFPPLEVAFGTVRLPLTAKVLIAQRNGQKGNGKPLLYMGMEGEKKYAYFLGNGLWQWRMIEYAKMQQTTVFDELISKTIKYLSVKNDKRKLKFYPSKNEFVEHEAIEFRAELYDDIYQRIYRQNIELTLGKQGAEKKKYQFAPTGAFDKLKVGDLASGIYDYAATTEINGKKHQVKGQFSVKESHLEHLKDAANHHLLRQISDNNQGQFCSIKDLKRIQDNIEQMNYQGIRDSHQDLYSILYLKWLLGVLVLMVTVEWFLRKYFGGY